MKEKRTRRQRGLLYVSRDTRSGDGSWEEVLFTVKEPKVIGAVTCEHCLKPSLAVGHYEEVSGDLGMDPICYSGFLRATGIVIKEGEVKRIRIVEVVKEKP